MEDPEQFRRWAAAVTDTPVLVADRQRVEHNIAAMAAHAASERIALRPHAKTHKSPVVAELQRSAGAVGHAVATIGEAEVLAAHGALDLFVAYPLWADGDLGSRIATLAERTRLCIGADSVAGIGRLRAAAGARASLEVLVEIDCGLHRSGIAPVDAGAVAVAAKEAGFGVRGVFTFPGHSYGPGAAQGAIADEERALVEASAAVEAAGIPCEVRSGGSTPTSAKTAGGTVNELRPGV